MEPQAAVSELCPTRPPHCCPLPTVTLYPQSTRQYIPHCLLYSTSMFSVSPTVLMLMFLHLIFWSSFSSNFLRKGSWEQYSWIFTTSEQSAYGFHTRKFDLATCGLFASPSLSLNLIRRPTAFWPEALPSVSLMTILFSFLLKEQFFSCLITKGLFFYALKFNSFIRN